MIQAAGTSPTTVEVPRQGGRGFPAHLFGDPATIAGTTIVLLTILLALGWPWLTPYDPVKTSLGQALNGPSEAHWLGTDDLGRDVLSRVLAGTSTSLEVGVLSVLIALCVGVPLGLLAGYLGGWTDLAVMRVMDALMAFPALVLALAIAAAIGAGLVNVAIAVGVVYVPQFARLVRGPCLVLKSREFVEAARVAGAGAGHILLRHVLPNTTSLIVVQAALSVGFAIVAEASLSFLGVGVQPSTPSWGGMLKAGYPYLEQAPWISIAPGAVLAATVLGYLLLGDGISAALDPRQLRQTGTR